MNLVDVVSEVATHVEDLYDVTVETVRLVVSDNGPGLPESAKAALSNSEADGAVGGLRIVRHLVSEYGGGVTVDDNEPRGTTIAVDLPAGEAEAAG